MVLRSKTVETLLDCLGTFTRDLNLVPIADPSMLFWKFLCIILSDLLEL